MILTVEVVASGFHLDELTDQGLTWDIAEDHILRVVIKDDKLVGDSRSCFSFLFFEFRLDLFHLFALEELWMLSDLSE